MLLRRLTSFNLSVSERTSDPEPDLRPCQQAYMGESNLRRILKRSHLCRKTSQEEPIFVLHEEAAKAAAKREAASREAALPFSDTSPSVSTGYSVQCYATHAEDEQRRREAEAAEKEKMTLFHSINSSRQVEGMPPLRLKPLLGKYAQEYADVITHEDHNTHNRHSSPTSLSTANLTQQNSVVVVMSPTGTRVARLVSPPRIGALACGEMWYGGKYKRHLYSLAPDAVHTHPEDCPCHLRMVFETMVDEGWMGVGIGRAEDGRWVVELGQ